MKNYLIKHAARQIEKFFKLAQEIANQFETALQELNAIFSKSQGDKQVLKFYRNETVKKILDSLKDLSGIETDTPEFTTAIYSLHLLINELTSEVNDAVSNPDIDEELAELGESDFYLDFEEVLLNVQNSLEQDYDIDTESDEYKSIDTSMLGSFLKNENAIDESARKKDDGLSLPAGGATKGFAQRVREQIESFTDTLKDFDKTPKMIALSNEIINILTKEKLPLATQADDTKKNLSDQGIPHFIKKDILDPNVLKKEYHPDGRVKRKKLWINVVNPEWKASGGDIINKVEKVNGRIMHIFATLKRLNAEYNMEHGITPDIDKVVPELQPLYKKLVDLQNFIYTKQNVLSHSGKSGPVTKSLKYIISRLLESKNNPFDIHKTTNAQELANIQDYMDNIGSKSYAWVNKSKYVLNQESGKFILANLDNLQQNSNHVTTDLNNTFFQDILFKTFIETREGDFSALNDFLLSLEKIYEIKKDISLLGERGLELEARIKARDKSLTNEDLNLYHNINAKLKTAAKTAAALYKVHTKLVKELGKTITKLSSQLAEGEETFDNPKLNELASFLRTLYTMRKERNALAQVVMKLESDKNATLSEEESGKAREMFSRIEQNIDILFDSPVVNWGEDKVTGRGGSLKTSLKNMKDACRASIELFNERVSGE